jgi:single-strand DNA-binding protein
VNEITTVIVGNLTGEPEMRFTDSSVAVCKFRVASTPRTYNRDKGEYVDGVPTFMACTAWRQLAENIAASNLPKGAQVIVYGALQQRDFEVEGQKRSVIEMTVYAIGPSLQYATATPVKTSKGGGGGGKSGGDPWAGMETTKQAPNGGAQPTSSQPTNAEQSRAAQAGAASPAAPW